MRPVMPCTITGVARDSVPIMPCLPQSRRSVAALPQGPPSPGYPAASHPGSVLPAQRLAPPDAPPSEPLLRRLFERRRQQAGEFAEIRDAGEDVDQDRL